MFCQKNGKEGGHSGDRHLGTDRKCCRRGVRGAAGRTQGNFRLKGYIFVRGKRGNQGHKQIKNYEKKKKGKESTVQLGGRDRRGGGERVHLGLNNKKYQDIKKGGAEVGLWETVTTKWFLGGGKGCC